jgi:hypothetical protein
LGSFYDGPALAIRKDNFSSTDFKKKIKNPIDRDADSSLHSLAFFLSVLHTDHIGEGSDLHAESTICVIEQAAFLSLERLRRSALCKCIYILSYFLQEIQVGGSQLLILPQFCHVA